VRVVSTGVSDTRSDAKVAFNLRLPLELVDELDERAKALGISRNQWFSNMTRWVLENTETIERRTM
jgi:metal-responsive CopG/Arc/MetJ family transcriptional regulator